ncbi:hypothetical protein [Moritella marina]|uniref:hypothetical protein n=1 Tax=Moritella marina TaxID=90736 RepID=UPI003703C83F
MLTIKEKKDILRKRLKKYNPTELYNKLKSYSEDGCEGISAAKFIGKSVFNLGDIKWSCIDDKLIHDSTLVSGEYFISTLCDTFSEPATVKNKSYFNSTGANDKFYAVYSDNDRFDEAA